MKEKEEEKREKVTMKDVVREYELAQMGITHSVDGTLIDPYIKTLEFYHDSGMRETAGYQAIQSKYRGKLLNSNLDIETIRVNAKKYQLEIVEFKIKFFDEKMNEYQAGLSNE